MIVKNALYCYPKAQYDVFKCMSNLVLFDHQSKNPKLFTLLSCMTKKR